MQAEAIDKDYTERRGAISAYGRSVRSARSLKLLVFSVAVTEALLLLFCFTAAASIGSRSALFAALCVSVIGSIVIWQYTKKYFIEPESAIRKWIQDVCDGELNARIELPADHSHYKELDFHTRNLAMSLSTLTTDMETLVDTQTQRLEEQNHILELLFQLTSDVAVEPDLQTGMHKVCVHLSDWLNKANVAVYLLDEKNTLKLNATNSSNNSAFQQSRPKQDLPATNDTTSKAHSSAETTDTEVRKIPIFRNNNVIGMIEVIGTNDTFSRPGQTSRVLKTVSEQLSTFLLKEVAIESAQSARLIKARSQLGAELHDSLAQTILAAGYQVKLLGDTLGAGATNDVKYELERIQGTINEANTELRGLIGEYRKPLSEHRHADQINQLIDDFNQSSAIEVFFQLDDPRIVFTAREDTVVQRIVGEALNNAEKYSDATVIRVYIHTGISGIRCILIEDDGKGFKINEASQTQGASSGDHIGLSIMRDRALSIGAILTIESEPDEGTRVFLKLPPLELTEGDIND